MIFLLAAVFALIGFLNPFLAVVYGVGIVGDRLLKSGKLNIFFLAAFVCFGLIAVLGKLNRVDFFELSLLLLAVFVYFHLLLAKGSYDLAILGAGVFFFAGEYIIFASFNALFIQVIEKAFSAAGQMFAGSDNLQYLDLAKKIYLNNYPSLYGVLGLVSLYGSSILLGRKHEIPKFEFRNFDLPGWIDFWLIGGLLLSFFGKSLPLSLGSNLLFFLVALYVFVGMGVVFTVWKKWFEKSKILYVFFNEGINKVGASKASAFINLVPIVTIILSVLILKEKPILSQIIGSIVILLGVYISQNGLPNLLTRRSS